LINFFQGLAGTRAMPNLFPSEFDEENLIKYKNKAKQLGHLFDKYFKHNSAQELLQILIDNLSTWWSTDHDSELNEIIEPLHLICINGDVQYLAKKKEQTDITFGQFSKLSEEIEREPEKEEEILTKYGVSKELYDEFLATLKKFSSDCVKIVKSPITESLSQVMKISESFMKNLFNFPVQNLNIPITPLLINQTVTRPSLKPTIEGPLLKGMKIFRDLCQLNKGYCALPEEEIDKLNEDGRYAFLIYPIKDKYDDLVEISRKVLSKREIPLKTAIADSFIGAGFCKICRLVKFSSLCIAELGDLNQNVFLEIGLSMGFGKFLILTLNEDFTKQEDVPFDIKPFMNIPYQEKDVLEKKLTDYIDELSAYLDQ
jgi:hypothetical protein